MHNSQCKLVLKRVLVARHSTYSVRMNECYTVCECVSNGSGFRGGTRLVLHMTFVLGLDLMLMWDAVC